VGEVHGEALRGREVYPLMATGKVERSRPGVTSRSAATALSKLSGQMYHDTLHVFEKLIDAGASNLMQGYASSIIISDFLHSAGLITDHAYNNVDLLSDMIGGVGVFEQLVGGLFGSNALAPVLKTRTDIAGGGESPDSQATTAATTLGLAGQIAAALA